MGKTFTAAMDRKCICIHCGNTFTFSVGEQVYYAQHSLKAPKRCKMCRKLKTHNYENTRSNIYAGLSSMLPKLYKCNFKGGVDVTDISGKKYRCYSYYGF